MPWWMAIPLAIGAGTEIYKAVKGSNAAKDAAQTQAEAGEKALALQEKMYQQTRADLSPWMTSGQRANSTLSYAMGLGSVPFQQPGSGGQSTEALRVNGTPSARSSVGQPIMGYAVPRGSTAAAGRTASLADVARAVPRGAADTQSASGYVQMRAPDGTVQAVPSQYADHFAARGAVRV